MTDVSLGLCQLNGPGTQGFEYTKLPMIVVVLDVFLSGESDGASGNHKGMKE